MHSEVLKVGIPITDGQEVPALVTIPRNFCPLQTPGLILAHGTGSDMEDEIFRYLHVFLVGRGYMTVRFNFLYRVQGRKTCDSDPRLEHTLQQVVAYVRKHPRLKPGPLFLGGRSQGGRIASQVVAGGLDVDGLVLLAYPLHAPGRPDRLRDLHLPSLRVPSLFISGTRDALAPRERLEPSLARVPQATLQWVEGGDHSFKMKRSSGVAAEDVWRGISENVAEWLDSCSGHPTALSR